MKGIALFILGLLIGGLDTLEYKETIRYLYNNLNEKGYIWNNFRIIEIFLEQRRGKDILIEMLDALFPL